MNVFTSGSCLIAIILTVIVKTVKVQIYTPGDVKIVGLFRIHETEDGLCGIKVALSSVMASEAVKWYLDGLNTNGQLPFKIGFEGYKTCRQSNKAAELAIALMNRSLANDGIAGIIGPEFSSEAEVISPVLSSVSSPNRLAQVGFSTTAARLNDDNKFPNLVRVVPTDDVQVEVMIQSMVQLQWNRIAIIFEEDTYGTEATARLKSRAEMESICVSMTERISVIDGIDPTEISNLLNRIIIGSGSRPSISGIVYIGSSSTAWAVLYAINSAGYSSVPIVMLSDGVNMDTSVFRQSNGQVFSKAKGSLVLGPTYREVTEFTLHWKSIFTNKTYFGKESTTNPWLLDVFYDVTQCQERNCEFTELSESEFSKAFGVQPLYIQYSILAAHALVKGINMVHNDLCSPPGSCITFETDFRSGDVLEKLKGLNIDMAKDFQWRLESLSNQGFEISVSPSGEMLVPENQSTYQLFNFRTAEGSKTDFKLVKIGDYTDTNLTIDTGKIRDYDNSGELLWPDVRKGQCNIESKCAECIPIQDLHEGFIYEPGDIYVIAVVPVFDQSGTDGCGSIRKVSGYQTVASIRFAIEKVNKKTGDYANFFPGLKVGLIVLNSCNNPVVIQRKILDLHKNGITLQNGTVINLTNKVIGYVGDIGSGVSIGVAEVLSRLHFTQISFASTSPLLSDRSTYPYFLRIVSPDDAQAKAMIGIIQKLNANYVQIVYSVGTYGEGGKDKVKEAAFENKICVVQEIPVEETGSSYEIFEQLRKFAYAKIVIIFLRAHRVETIMAALTSQIENRGEFIFIGSEAWARKNDPLKNDDRQNLLGSYTLSIEIYQDSELRDYIRNLEPKPYNKNPWSLTYLQTKRNCYFYFSFDKKTMANKCTSANDYKNDPNFDLDSWDTSAFVAAKCLLFGVNDFLKQKCGNLPAGLCDEFTSNTAGLVAKIRATKLDLDGSGNKIKVFNGNGDGNVGYRIYNIQKDENLQNLIYVEVGRYPLEGTFTFEKRMTVNPTDSDLVSRCPNEQACSGCFQDDTYIKPPGSEKSLNIGMLVLGVLLALAVIVVVILIVILLRTRKVNNKANETTYITPMSLGQCENMQRQEAVGSEGFAEIPACMPPENEIQTTDT